MEELRLPKKTLRLWQIRVNIAGLLLLFIFSYLCHSFNWFSVTFIIIAVLIEVILLWYLPTLFKRYRIKYIKGAVIIESGVVIRTTHIMPFSKLIYTQSLTTPLSKLMGLKALTLKAARSRVLIPEIEDEDVEKFISALAGVEV